MENWLEYCDSAFGRILTGSGGATLLAVCVLVASRTLGDRIPPRHGYALWLLVVATLLAPGLWRWSVPLNLSLYGEELAAGFAELPTVAPSLPLPVAEGPTDDGRDDIVSPLIAPTRIDARRRTVEESVVLAHADKSRLTMRSGAIPDHIGRLWRAASRDPLHKSLPILWLVGLVLLSVRAVLLHIFWRFEVARCAPVEHGAAHDALAAATRTLGLRRMPTLRISERLHSPAITGAFRPVILLPRAVAQHSEESVLRFIFLHELAHIRRGDPIVNAVVRSLLLVHWFNPFLYLARREIRTCQEHLCDARVIYILGADHATGYGHALLDLFQSGRAGRMPSAALPMFSGKPQLTRRIKMISNGTLLRRGISWPALGLFLALAPLAVFDVTFAAPAQTVDPPPLPRETASPSVVPPGTNALEDEEVSVPVVVNPSIETFDSAVALDAQVPVPARTVTERRIIPPQVTIEQESELRTYPVQNVNVEETHQVAPRQEYQQNEIFTTVTGAQPQTRKRMTITANAGQSEADLFEMSPFARAPIGSQVVKGTLYVLSVGIDWPNSQPLPDRFAELLPELEELGGGAVPVLLDAAKFRTRVGEGFSITSHLLDNDSGEPQEYTLEIGQIQLGGDGAVGLGQIQFQTQLQSKGQARPVMLNISPDLKSGELTLLGSASVRGVGQAIVLVGEIAQVE